MKKIKSIIMGLPGLLVLAAVSVSCVGNLLDQTPTHEMDKKLFWKESGDATIALMGVYATARPCFSYEYDFDGMTEIVWTRGIGNANNIINTAGFNPTTNGFKPLWDRLYGTINRANYVVEGVDHLLTFVNPAEHTALERVRGEAMFLRALCYFRLVSLWGDVPYFTKTVDSKDELDRVFRMPIAEIKDNMISDLDYAVTKIPDKVTATETGRASGIAARALRGKIELFWASWNRFGWPELDGFVPSEEKARAAYTAAAEDFRAVIYDYGLDLFRGGAPGLPGEAGKCETLPNYFYLFTPDYDNPVSNSEIIFGFAYSGPNLGQGSNLMNDLGNRQTENSQSYVSPSLDLANCYQLIATGDFAPPLIPMNGNAAGARTTPNSAVNPDSYEGRDFRCRSTILWDYEVMVKLESLSEKGTATWLYKASAPYIQASAMETGYVPRKFIRDKSMGCARNDDPQDLYLIRLADVFLMYAEATNFLDGPQPDAIGLVNRIRTRAGLPDLASEKTASAEEFFKAIEQERKVELVMEGQRYFDIRRWRRFEEVWGPVGGTGRLIRNTWNEVKRTDFASYQEINKQRYYIMNIPQAERNLNPNLTQNTPWL